MFIREIEKHSYQDHTQVQYTNVHKHFLQIILVAKPRDYQQREYCKSERLLVPLLDKESIEKDSISGG